MADILLDNNLFLARNVRQALESRSTDGSLTRFIGSRGCQRKLNWPPQSPVWTANEISERPGEGMAGVVDGRRVQVTSRRKLLAQYPEFERDLPPPGGGLECVILIESA